MTLISAPANPIHWAARMYAADCRSGGLNRREFLSRATALGVTSATAYGLLGLAQPAHSQAAIQPGGTLRIQQNVKALGDPRTYDWSEMGNISRGLLEYLVEYKSDGTLRGMLLESWTINDDATEYVLNIRPGITWNNGDPFTAQDVARNIEGWCDKSLPGNSMAARFATLIDPDTGAALAGAITVTGPLSVRLKLPSPDITLIPGMSDYPAAIVHASFAGDPLASGIGTGPYRIAMIEPGVRAVLERNTATPWWGSEIFGGPYLDRIEFIDLGTDPSSYVAAAKQGDVDLLYETVGEFVDVMDATGWTRSEVNTGATTVVRGRQSAEIDGQMPYADKRVRQALALAVDNAVCLELGYFNRGTLGENHHVGPVHPDYADIGPAIADPAAAKALMAETDFASFEHQLITVDDDWQRNTGDAVAAQLNDAGIPVRRTLLPSAEFSQAWREHAFSSTAWNHRPLGIQIIALAYRSGEAWNESAYSNPEFDRALAKAMSLADLETRRHAMADIQQILRDDAVIIQPFWRTLYTHHNGRVVGAEKHPSHEMHLYNFGFSR